MADNCNSNLPDEVKGDSFSDFDSDVTYFSGVEDYNPDCKKSDVVIKSTNNTGDIDGTKRGYDTTDDDGLHKVCRRIDWKNEEIVKKYHGKKDFTALEKEEITNKAKKAKKFLMIYDKWTLGKAPFLQRNKAESILNEIRQEKLDCNILLKKYKDSGEQVFQSVCKLFKNFNQLENDFQSKIDNCNKKHSEEVEKLMEDLSFSSSSSSVLTMDNDILMVDKVMENCMVSSVHKEQLISRSKSIETALTCCSASQTNNNVVFIPFDLSVVKSKIVFPISDVSEIEFRSMDIGEIFNKVFDLISDNLS